MDCKAGGQAFKPIYCPHSIITGTEGEASSGDWHEQLIFSVSIVGQLIVKYIRASHRTWLTFDQQTSSRSVVSVITC